MKHHLQWVALPHCPEKQLQPTNPSKAGQNDAGLDLRIAEDVIVKPFSAIPFTYEWVKPVSEWEGEALNPEISENMSIRDGVPWVVRKKHNLQLISTGIKLIHPNQESLSWVALYLRSSMSRYGIGLANQVGVIDLSYSGEVLIAAYSRTHAVSLAKGEAIAQLVPHPQFHITLEQVSEDYRTQERKGFGSTN
jgi:dUTPase